jgi:hypothetical protein
MKTHILRVVDLFVLLALSAAIVGLLVRAGLQYPL